MRYLFFIVIPVLLCASCKPECRNDNPVLNKYKPSDREYINELAKLVQQADKSNIDGWINSYEQVNNREYMFIDLVGKGICGIAMMDITGNKSLENFRQVKGTSYNGAFLDGLQFDILHTDSGSVFVFKDVDNIID